MYNYKKFFLFIVSTFLISLCWWLFYIFNIFPKYYFNENVKFEKDQSAIVVLTGGKGRFERGLSLLKEGKSSKMFVTGVFPGLDLKKKYINTDDDARLFECCIFNGSKAVNTIENASEVSEWLKNNSVSEIFLVSSYYHLPRSKIVFERYLSDIQVHLVKPSYPDFKSESILDILFHLKVLVTEFLKIIYLDFFKFK